jgi:hypothetical protein
MATKAKTIWRELVVDVQRRVPAGQRLVQEAFTSDHHHPVMIKLNEATPESFYWFEESTACAFFDAVVDWAIRQSGGQLTLSYTAVGELQAQTHRLQHAAGKLEQIRVLAVGRPSKDVAQGARLEYANIARTALTRYRLALAETRTPLLFIAREEPARRNQRPRSLGFFSGDAELISEIAEDVEAVLHGQARKMACFERLELLHETTQQVARELESYSRRMELAVERARRRPDLLTPARFERIVTQAIAKMEQLKEIPRRALQKVGKPRRQQ